MQPILFFLIPILWQLGVLSAMLLLIFLGCGGVTSPFTAWHRADPLVHESTSPPHADRGMDFPVILPRAPFQTPNLELKLSIPSTALSTAPSPLSPRLFFALTFANAFVVGCLFWAFFSSRLSSSFRP
ncbi:hypothetical protein B0T22DRAFT_296352 [Podospora appendiculata]|uniref:Uncharacterized protein n=1 Tax=Podospora appendiculata TaxID=314037 RepID=A0AAE0X1N9_9PEZI|nr:hypothetical protein B0T22DRAFT_296352 [Podospora appendiculata]